MAQFPGEMAGNNAAETAGGARVFDAKQRVGVQAAAFIAGGVLFLLMLIVQFLLALGRKSTPTTDMMPGIIGGLSVFGIALLARGIFLLRGVTRVVLDDAGVRVEGFIARRSVPYQQIERIERDKQTQFLAGKTNEVLLLRAAGETKPLAMIPDTVADFELLAGELAWRTAAAQGGRTTYDPIADQQTRQTRESKHLKLVGLAMSVFALLFLGAFCYGVYEEVNDRRLKRSGTRVDARISQRFMRRVTPYIAYTFRDRQGRVHSREVMVTQEVYDRAEGAATVAVVYLPEKPEWNRLASGDASKSFGGKSLFLFGGVGLMFGAFAVMTLMGIDIKTENGRTLIVRRGKVIREWGTARPASKPPPFALPPLPAAATSSPALPSEATSSPPVPSTAVATAVSLVAMPASTPPTVLPSLPPQPMVPPAPAPAPGLPKGLVALGVLSIVFGCLGAAMNLLAWVRLQYSHTFDVGVEVIEADQPRWADHWALVDAALAAALVLVGVALLMRKRWSRPIGIPVAALQVLSSLAAAGMIMASMWNAPEPEGAESMPLVAFNVALVVFRLLTAVFPAVLLWILMKRSTAAVLGRNGQLS